MKPSGDLYPTKPKPGFAGTPGNRVIARDRAIEGKEFTAETRRRGEGNRASALEALRRVLKTVRAALSEIFDESAYQRFLGQTGASRSLESYRDFMRDREAAMVKKPRCC